MTAFDRKAALSLVFQSDVKLTPQAYIKAIQSRFSLSRSRAKTILRQFILDQELSYQYLYGASYIEKSFLKPVQVSKTFIVKPPGFSRSPGPDHIEIILAPGISFGSGQHPTTQLVLQAIDFCFFDPGMMNRQKPVSGVDIGTGSGVLAMAMCLAGLDRCTAYEIDPVSICESKKNIDLNGLAEKITVVEKTMTAPKSSVSMVCANLRFPTLKNLSCLISSSLGPDGIAILSGVREWEKDALVSCYRNKGFHLIWQQDEKKWSAFVLVKKV